MLGECKALGLPQGFPFLNALDPEVAHAGKSLFLRAQIPCDSCRCDVPFCDEGGSSLCFLPCAIRCLLFVGLLGLFSLVRGEWLPGDAGVCPERGL